ncbi:phosphatase PAP2 family protein [Nocardia mangyaensis]|uniref:phosphatase PAP2 family protein n=1 Tax=Nocardia mangyaensis TaxID=2213200 RepID=UPI001F0ABC09|nr:phosphatase PAP2 family protein [Nocardia mangyaensis]
MIDSATRSGALRATVIAAGAAVTAAIPATFPADGGPTPLDAAMSTRIDEAVSPTLGQWLVAPSNGPVVLLALIAGCAWFALRRRWWAALTMLVVPEVAVAINTWVLKPVWERQLHDYLAYPSGHTVHLVTVATAFACLVRDLRARCVIAALTVLAVLALVVGMVERDHHYPTDVLGGAAAGVSMAVGLCWISQMLRTHARRASSSR